jgi:hypothetical protein
MRSNWNCTMGVVVAMATACTSLSTVRSAEVRPGPALTVQASGSTPTGDLAGWFWSYDCATSCTTNVPGLDASIAFGHGMEDGKGSTFGFGTSGFYPFLEVYTQLDTGRTPFGIGGRIGLPLIGWSEHRLYGRMDFPAGNGKDRLLWNPGLVLTMGASPNGENTGTFIGVTNGLGIQMGDGGVVWTPSVSLVSGRASINRWGEREGPEWSTFMTAAMSVSFRRKK